MKSTGILLFIALLLLALPRLPQAQPTQHGSVTFTIYQNGIALVHYRSNLVIIEQADDSRVMLPGIEGYRITAMNIPDVDTPFPRILLDAETTRGGRQSVQLYYLMHGLRWDTEFTLRTER